MARWRVEQMVKRLCFYLFHVAGADFRFKKTGEGKTGGERARASGMEGEQGTEGFRGKPLNPSVTGEVTHFTSLCAYNYRMDISYNVVACSWPLVFSFPSLSPRSGNCLI